MTQHEELRPDHTLTSIVKSALWTPIGKGSYNEALISDRELTIYGRKGYWVGKTPHDESEMLSASTRAVRKWNELNPEYPAYLSIFGMIVPYLGKTPATDDQIAVKIVDIYRQTRNIILDAGGRNNFLVHEGKVICVDVDVALRRGSLVSDSFRTERDMIEDYLVGCSRAGKPQTVSVIRTLLYLQKHLAPKDIKDEYINLQFIEKLHILRDAKLALTPQIMSGLLDIIRSDIVCIPEDSGLIEFVKRMRPTPLSARHAYGFFSEGFYKGVLIAAVAAMIVVPIALNYTGKQSKGTSP